MEPNNPNVPDPGPPAGAPGEPVEQPAAHQPNAAAPEQPAAEQPTVEPVPAMDPPALPPVSDPVASEPVAPKLESAGDATRPVQPELPTAAPPAPEISAEEKERRKKALDSARVPVLDLCTANQRPKPAAVTAAVEAYVQAWRDSHDPAAQEWQQLRACVAERWGRILAQDQQQHIQAAADLERHPRVYTTLFEQLLQLEQSLAGEVERMREDQEAFQKAPKELQSALLNYKKGIEIIQRMVKRLQDRKKPPAPPLPAAAPGPALAETPPDAEQWAAALDKLCQDFHESRAARGEALRNAQKLVDQIKRETLTIVKSLLGAIDGIESGQRSEDELLANLEKFRPDHSGLIDPWFCAYQRLEDGLKPFYAATGIEPQTVDPGTPFHPDTMEPGGTVTDPKRSNEEK